MPEEMYQKFNPKPSSWAKAIQRWLRQSETLRYLAKTGREIATRFGLKPSPIITLDDPRHPQHQAWIKQDPKHARFIMAHKHKEAIEKPNFFLKWVVKPVVNYLILPITAVIARSKRSYAAMLDEKTPEHPQSMRPKITPSPKPEQTKLSTDKARIDTEMNRIEQTKRNYNIKRTAEIKRKNIVETNRATTAVLSPVSPIKIPPSAHANHLPASSETESPNASNDTSLKALRIKPKDPTKP